MHINGDVAGFAILALSLFACTWQSRIQANPKVLSIIGWVVNVLTALALLACWIRG